MKRLAVLLSSLFLAAACGSKAPATSTTGGGEPATAVLPDVPFDQLDHDQQIQFMKEKVVPAMAPLFQAHDATEFAEFGCKTCHGPGAEQGEFEMPNAGLPKLNFADMSTHDPKDLEWMSKVIKPTMAQLLGEAEYTEANPAGFGCTGCHGAEAP